jgi:hypothetical protein
MPSDRDLAQQWLAQRIRAGVVREFGEDEDWAFEVLLDLAAYILDTPGVEVEEHWNPAVDVNTTWLVIKLPPTQLGVAAHQHTEEGT